MALFVRDKNISECRGHFVDVDRRDEMDISHDHDTDNEFAMVGNVYLKTKTPELLFKEKLIMHDSIMTDTVVFVGPYSKFKSF